MLAVTGTGVIERSGSLCRTWLSKRLMLLPETSHLPTVIHAVGGVIVSGAGLASAAGLPSSAPGHPCALPPG